MVESELGQFQGLIDSFHERFEPCFSRKESRAWARKYVTGLLLEMERKNCWQLAEKLRLSPKELKAMQHFLYGGTWDHRMVIERLGPFVYEYLNCEGAQLIVDESAVRKWGKKSVGVARQYLGCVGKKDNGQVGVYLNYASERGHAFIDERLYIPEEWFGDRERCQEAGIPETVVFRTKPELAAEMVRAAIRRGIGATWLTADELYGRDRVFLDDMDALGLLYVVEVPKDTQGWLTRPRLTLRPGKTKDGKCRKARLSPDSPDSARVDAIARDLTRRDWQRIAVAEGTKGILVYDFAFRRFVQKRDGLPGPDSWLMLRKGLEQEPEVKYYLCNAPKDTDHEVIAKQGSSRRSIEAGLKEGKGQAGLDEYEVRCWNSWHHHTTLALVAHAFLVALTVEQKKIETVAQKPGCGGVRPPWNDQDCLGGRLCH